MIRPLLLSNEIFGERFLGHVIIRQFLSMGQFSEILEISYPRVFLTKQIWADYLQSLARKNVMTELWTGSFVRCLPRTISLLPGNNLIRLSPIARRFLTFTNFKEILYVAFTTALLWQAPWQCNMYDGISEKHIFAWNCPLVCPPRSFGKSRN